MAAYGRFIPKFPEKYIGDVDKIFFRSSWEISVMKWLDSRPAITKWCSEEIQIPYLGPDGKLHNYFPDFYMEYVDETGVTKKAVLEIKPQHEAVEKYAKHDRSKNALEVNKRKWAAAEDWCRERGYEFKVLTEKSIFYQGQKRSKS